MYIERLQVCVHKGNTMRGHNEKVATCKPRRGASEETISANTLTLDFWPLRGNKFLLFKQPTLLYFVMAAFAN